MATKKQDKKDTKVIKEEPVEVKHPEENAGTLEKIETEGYGRFEYRNGTVYEGHWILLNGRKVKNGEGTLIHAGTTSNEAGNEEYRGSWKEDKMDGFGVYRYTSGAIYKGEWVNNKQEGRGVYEFPGGMIYEGEWKDHKMHGEGSFIDKEGNRWEGEFVNGVFQSKMQKQLKLEKLMKRKEEEILANARNFFTKFEQAYANSDKRTYKENLAPFFAGGQDEIKQFYKEPYPKYEERKPEQWLELISLMKAYTIANVLRHKLDAKVVDPNNILCPQFAEQGQIVEFTRTLPDLSLIHI
eukprot:TRINITY_DN7385_c0_g1_i1.p1 TRINITY_DN7385_c0_g1~~TRINITY_DN7385_c0_g1_i1.p1  ORF type:complete len:297 (+),score=90.66 TRINITY_DN7385_c0_g1_i1:313-1203(+)